MANLERETEEALGLPPRAKETKPTVQEYMDDTGAMGLLTGPMSRGSGLLGGATAAYQFGRDLLGFNEQADDRALAGRKDDEGITPTKNYIYDLAIDKLGATPYQAQTVAMLAEATPIAGEYLGIEETANLIKEGRYKDAALSGAGTAAGIIPFIGDAAKAALRRGVDPEVVNQIIAGKGAKDFYGDDLRKAVELEERGFSPEEIEEITGRFTVGSAEDDYFSAPLMVRGEPKPYFKFEIDDSDVLIKSNDGNITLKETSPSQTANVGDIIDHPKLFEQYPEARNIQFYFDDAKESGAHFNPSKGSRGSIVISGSRKDIDVNDQDFRNSFFHELQHAIQWQDKKIKGLEQIAGSPMGYMKTVAKPEKAYKGDLYLKKLGQNTKLINIKDEILELYKEGQKTYSFDSKSPYKTIFVNPEAAKKIAKLMRSLEQESFRTYMQTASEIEARVSGYRSFPQTEFQKKYNKPKNPIVPEIKKQTRIETSEEAYQNMPNEPIVQASNRAIYKLKPMTDEEIIRYANGAVNFARYAEGIDPELKGFSAWGPTQKGYAQGGLTSMNDQMGGAFEKGALILDLNNNNTNKNNTVKNYDPLEALTQEYNILREKEIKRIESGNLQKHDSGSVEDMDEYAYERQILDWLKSKSKDQPIGGYDANANSSIFSDLPSFWKAPHDHEHSTLGGVVDPNKYKSKFDAYREFFRKVPEEYLNNHPNSENLKFMQKVFKEMDRQEPMVARGGLIEMNDQTQRAFALGGEAETVDPVSGNDVPPGSLPEEVRDDIDAKLSEGEYVVPADVVRFFGVKFFEDLRTEAKMGLQQMDADGRIGGEPVQEQPQGQEDSMDVAELKAALSSSGMYAGGLTDGNSLDNFIDDASRSPMVNGRMRAGGASVKMAVGGLAIGNFGDVTKVDGIIKQLMTAANKDPALMEKLASKGIMVNKTGADKKSAEMQQANKPQEPIEAAEGTYVNPFDFKKYGTLGSQLANFDEEMVIESFKNPEGEIKQIILIDAYGNEIPVAWNTAMEIPEGFTRKDSDVLGELTFEVAPVAITSEVPRKLDSRAGEKSEGDLDFERRVAANRVNSVSSNPSDGGFNWSTASAEDVNKRLKNNKNMRYATGIAGLLVGLAPPVALAINIAHGAYNRAENENARKRLDQLKQESENWNPLAMDSPEYKDKDGKFDKAKYRKATKQLTDPLKKAQSELTLRMKDASLPSKDIGEAFSGGTSIKGTIQDTIKSISDVFVGGVYDAFGDTRKEAGTTLGEPVVGSKSGPEKVTQLQKAQQLATNTRLVREERDRQAREAAEAAARASAQASANAERVRGSTGSYYTGDTGSSGERYFNTSGGGGGYTDSSGTNQYLGGGDQGWTNPTNEREMAARSSARAVSRGATSAPTRSDGKYSGSGRATGGFGRATGGLVSMPATKKKKKQTTQRRKGLGTRP